MEKNCSRNSTTVNLGPNFTLSVIHIYKAEASKCTLKNDTETDKAAQQKLINVIFVF